jgi:hypothetical protein
MSNPTVESLLALPRFGAAGRALVLLAKSAGVDDADSIAHGIQSVRSELGRLLPGGDLRRIGTPSAKSGTLSASVKGQTVKDLADSPALWVGRVGLALEALGNDGVTVPTVNLSEAQRINVRLLCGLKAKS